MSKLIFFTPYGFDNAEVAIVASKITAVANINGKANIFIDGMKDPCIVVEDFAEVTEKLKELIK